MLDGILQTTQLDVVEKIASIIESLAVVVSLIYVAFQFRMNTKAARSGTYQNIISSIANIETRIFENEKLTQIFTDGCAGELKPGEDQERFNRLMSSFFNFYENLYYQYRNKWLEKEMAMGWYRNLDIYLKKPGVKAWWNTINRCSVEAFRNLLTEQNNPDLKNL